MTPPKISVIVPAYNAEATIETALNSILRQSYSDIEVIVVDDASDDRTSLVLGKIKDSRVRLLRHHRNRGAAAARNTAIRNAKGKYVAFLDADDEWLPEKLREQLKFLEVAPPITRSCCTSHFLERSIGGNTRVIEQNPSADSFERLLLGCDLSPGTTLFARKDCFDDVGFFDESMRRLEDWDWLLRYAQHFRIGLIPTPLARIRVTGAPAFRDVLNALQRLKDKHLETVRVRGAMNARKFKSSLLLEQAAANYRNGQTVTAGVLVTRSILSFPFRNRRFFARMYDHSREAAGWYPAVVPNPDRRVLHVITDLDVGGAERSLISIALATKQRNWTPIVASLVPGGLFAATLRNSNVPVRQLGMKSSRHALFGLLRLAAVIRRERPAVIQGWMYHADLVATLALVLSGRWRKTKLFWGVRCSDMDFSKYNLQLRLVVRLCALLSRLPYGVIANSDAGREVHKRLGYKPKHFYVVHNGIETDRLKVPQGTRTQVRRELGLPPNGPVIATVARLDPMKDYECFLAALERLPGIDALAIGRGTENLPDRPKLRRLGQRDDIAELLAASDILVSSSAFGEGFSNAIAEGMAAGLPVVATDIGDARRMVGNAGIIVKPRDPEALAAALKRLIEAPEARARLGALGRRRVEDLFSLETALMGFENAYLGVELPAT
jgi:glycosyltransferase involved in cell wall biosynthesis